MVQEIWILMEILTESAALNQNANEKKQILNEIQQVSDVKIWVSETCSCSCSDSNSDCDCNSCLSNMNDYDSGSGSGLIYILLHELLLE